MLYTVGAEMSNKYILSDLEELIIHEKADILVERNNPDDKSCIKTKNKLSWGQSREPVPKSPHYQWNFIGII